MRDVIEMALFDALNRCEGDVAEAAARLQIGRATLYRWTRGKNLTTRPATGKLSDAEEKTSE